MACRGVDALADDGDIIASRNELDERLRARHDERRAVSRLPAACLAVLVEQAAQGRDVLGRRSAASSDDACAGCEDAAHRLGELPGAHVVDGRAVGFHARQAGVGLHHERAARVRRHLRDERGRLGGAEGAVDADGRGAERGQRRGRDRRRRAHEAAAILSKGHRRKDRQGSVLDAGEQRRLGLEQIGEGFEEDEVAAGLVSRAGLLGKDVVGLTEGERAQRRKQLAGGTDISGNQLRTCLACDARCGGVELVDARVGPRRA